MNDGKMAFSQLMAHGSRFVLDRCIRRYDGNRRVRSFSCRDQYLSMAFAQLTYRESVRDIEACLSAIPEKLYHMSFRSSVSRSTLADVNEHRDWRIYADFAQRLVIEARRLYVDEPRGLAGGVAACGGATDGGNVEIRKLAFIDVGGGADTVTVFVPDTVTRGVAFEVTVLTYPEGCRTLVRPGDTEVTVQKLRADVIPYTIVTIPSTRTNCPDQGGAWLRRVTLAFADSGTGEVVVHGRPLRLGSPRDTVELQVAFPVTVRPR